MVAGFVPVGFDAIVFVTSVFKLMDYALIIIVVIVIIQ